MPACLHTACSLLTLGSADAAGRRLLLLAALLRALGASSSESLSAASSDAPAEPSCSPSSLSPAAAAALRFCMHPHPARAAQGRAAACQHPYTQAGAALSLEAPTVKPQAASIYCCGPYLGGWLLGGLRCCLGFAGLLGWLRLFLLFLFLLQVCCRPLLAGGLFGCHLCLCCCWVVQHILRGEPTAKRLLLKLGAEVAVAQKHMALSTHRPGRSRLQPAPSQHPAPFCPGPGPSPGSV